MAEILDNQTISFLKEILFKIICKGHWLPKILAFSVWMNESVSEKKCIRTHQNWL